MAAAAPAPGRAKWRGTPQQKVWGLTQVLGSVTCNFAFAERLPGLDWDAGGRAGTCEQQSHIRTRYGLPRSPVGSGAGGGRTLESSESWRS